jgi:predicted nucleotidyltransferase
MFQRMSPDLEPAVDLLAEALPGLAAVYVYGSAAAGRLRRDSDIDLAVYAGAPIDEAQLVELRETIARSLNRDVDLVDMATAPTVLQMEVLRAGPAIAAPRPTEAGLLELRIMRDYYDLKYRRIGIEQDIVRRGRVHA